MTTAAQRLAAAAALGSVAVLPRTRLQPVVQRADERLLGAVVARRRPSWREPARAISALAEPRPVVGLWLLAAGWAVRRGVPGLVVARNAATAAAGLAVRRRLAESIRRTRPDRSWWWATPTGFSYPSRHTAWAVLGFGAVADLVSGPADVPGAGAVLLRGMTPLVGATRLLLALHWPSDVAAAFVLGVAWRRLVGAPGGPR